MGLTLVTGASGFVGSHLMQEMTRRGLPVRGVTRGAAPGLITVPWHGPEMDWSNWLRDVDTVVHLAARVHVMRETASDPLSLFRETNVTATVNLARQAAAAGVRRFVFVSSIKVNGERTEPGKPFSADDPPNPRDPYGISKAEAESGLMALGRETGMEITIVRPPLVYGPGVTGNFRSLMKWAASGMPSIFTKVPNKRSLVYVGNLCDLLLTVLDHPNAANRIFLVSDGRALSTHELLTNLTVAFGRKPNWLPIPPATIKALALLAGKRAMANRLLENLEINMEQSVTALAWAAPFNCLVALRLTAQLNGKPE
ncbi:NAD-dependent epimerase/dehydratase family protein [Rhizobium sp. CECT 9324]|uniref:NAD-dependent epimerase/dehydratase family protein n=1 Tax=Rhizobium sp. CECT 9324 TaxID=2845820 RepID=UPI001E4AE236|nr:NAD-dependent epimerase/dehydratase family protein [Rhizobium sp. CECT 9324]CAH0343195.1 N-acetyl-alpha-D-glucosaminyl-diphospho-ditrans, octacis-undecaprenol 4-epimerase [Rhizobium sp. CECT 9324]